MKIVYTLVAVIMLVACASEPKQVPIFESAYSDDEKSAGSGGNKAKIPASIRFKYDNALAAMQGEKYQTAEVLLMQIIKLHPDLFGPYINLGIVKIKQEKYTDAEQIFLKMQQFQPENADIYNYLGIVYRNQGKFKQSEAAYKKAIKLNANLVSAYLNLGILYDLYLVNLPEAKVNYLKVKQLAPGSSRVDIWLQDLEQRMSKAQ